MATHTHTDKWLSWNRLDLQISAHNGHVLHPTLFSTFHGPTRSNTMKWNLLLQSRQPWHKVKSFISCTITSFSAHLMRHWFDKRNLSINPRKYHSLTLLLWKDQQMNPPIYYLGHPVEEVQPLEPPGLIISHDISLAYHIAKLISKASCRLGILHQSKSFINSNCH